MRTARAERQRRSRAQADNRAHKYGNCSVTTDVRIMAQHGEAPFRAHSHEEIMDCITLGGTTVHPDKVFLHIFPPGVRAPAPRARPAPRLPVVWWRSCLTCVGLGCRCLVTGVHRAGHVFKVMLGLTWARRACSGARPGAAGARGHGRAGRQGAGRRQGGHFLGRPLCRGQVCAGGLVGALQPAGRALRSGAWRAAWLQRLAWPVQARGCAVCSGLIEVQT